MKNVFFLILRTLIFIVFMITLVFSYMIRVLYFTLYSLNIKTLKFQFFYSIHNIKKHMQFYIKDAKEYYTNLQNDNSK